METATFTILVDNQAANGLVAEHGFSLLLETAGHAILFDTGNKGALLPNAKALACDLSGVSELVLSHGHYDHTGGIQSLLDVADGVQVYMHQAALQPRYVMDNGKAATVRMPAVSSRALHRLKENSLHWVTRPILIEKNIGITGPIARQTGYEDTGGAFFLDAAGNRPDPIADDIALWVETSSGLVVCVGCSHAGIVNTLATVMRITGKSAVHTVIGGLHLLHASEKRLEQTALSLQRTGIRQLVACHCTGDSAVDYLSRRLDCTILRGHAGLSLTL